MNKLFYLFFWLFLSYPALAVPNETTLEISQLKEDVTEQVKLGKLTDALLLVDEVYSLLEPDAPPFQFRFNLILRDAVGKAIQTPDSQAEENLKELTEGLKTPQAKAEIYLAYSRVEQQRISSRPLQETYEQHIHLLRNNMGNKISQVESSDTPETENIQEISKLQASIDTTEIQKSRPRIHPAERYWEIMQQYTNLPDTPDWIKPYIIVTSAMQYLRQAVISPQDCQSALAILNTPLTAIPPPKVADELTHLRVVAFLGLGRDNEALSVVERYLKPQTEDDPKTWGRYLLWRGRVLLQIRKVEEAGATAEELSSLNITEEPLASQISAFLAELPVASGK